MDNLESRNLPKQADCSSKSQDNYNIVVDEGLGWIRTYDEVKEGDEGEDLGKNFKIESSMHFY